MIAAVFLKFRPGAHGNLAAAGGIGLTDARAADDDAAGREIRALDILHQVGKRCLRIIQQADAGVNHLAEVVRRDVCRHTDRNTGGAVDQQVREAGGENARFLAGFIEVRVPIHRFLFDITQHFLRNARHTRLRITISGRRVAVDGTEVAVTVDQGRTHGEILRQTHERVIHGRVAVRMVMTQHVTDGGGALFIGVCVGQTALVHGIQNSSVHGLETVAHIRQCTADNDRHGVVDIAGLHFAHQFRLRNRLFREHDILGFIISVVCHTVSPP